MVDIDQLPCLIFGSRINPRLLSTCLKVRPNASETSTRAALPDTDVLL